MLPLRALRRLVSLQTPNRWASVSILSPSPQMDRKGNSARIFNPLPLCTRPMAMPRAMVGASRGVRGLGIGGIRGLETASVRGEELPLEELFKRADVLKVRSELAALPVQKISVVGFCHLCAKYDIPEPEALQLLSAFHSSGIVFNFSSSSSTALRETVFVKPKDVLDSVWATLDIKSSLAVRELAEKESELRALKGELEVLGTKKRMLDEIAEGRASQQVWLGSLIPITTFAALFRMTWWEFSWDIVEPISFFVSTMGPICFFYVWFAKHKEDFSLSRWHSSLCDRAKASLYRARAFDIVRYNQLIEAIAEVEEDIAELKQG